MTVSSDPYSDDTDPTLMTNRTPSLTAFSWKSIKPTACHPRASYLTTLAILPLLPATLALAEDFKTINGKIYKDAAISRVEADGIVIRTKTGISKIYFVELPKDVQERFLPSPAKTVAAQRERQPIKLEAKQDGRRQADRGGRVVVVGQSGVSWKVIVAGIVVLVVVVLAVVRSRF
jgi:hypothetical protein